jgi:hypothetical protein
LAWWRQPQIPLDLEIFIHRLIFRAQVGLV